MIDIYVNEIRTSLTNKCYFAALSLALTLPDICGLAEFSNNTSVAERYINWYDRYLGAFAKEGKVEDGIEHPWLSGEIVYNLRNTFLHQGSPTIVAGKVKNETNQLDKFILILGDGTVIQEFTLDANMDHGEVKYRIIMVDISYLCNCLCDVALWYYEHNKDRFSFDISVISQEQLQTENTIDYFIQGFGDLLLRKKKQEENT